MRKLFFTGILACLSFLFSYAQPSVRSSVDRNEILIGEQFHLKVEANFSRDLHRLRWVSVPDSLQHFEVVSRSKMDSVYTDNQLSGVSQTFTLTSFDSGKWVLPAFLVGIDPIKEGTSFNFFTDSVPLSVSFSVSDTTNQLRDIKPIKEVEVSNNWWYWVVGGALLVGLIIYLVWRSRKKKVQPATPVSKRSMLSAYDEAMQELKNLQQYDFADPVQLKVVHTKLGDILKQYLSRRENDHYLNKTTGDVLILLKKFGVGSELLASTAAALRSGDAVKFAKYLPSPGETGECINSVKLLIESFKQNNAQKPV